MLSVRKDDKEEAGLLCSAGREWGREGQYPGIEWLRAKQQNKDYGCVSYGPHCVVRGKVSALFREPPSLYVPFGTIGVEVDTCFNFKKNPQPRFIKQRHRWVFSICLTYH